jgi:hypothetical protein
MVTIGKEFDNLERVKNAAKELIRAVMWEHNDLAQGEDEKVIDKVIDDCMERLGDTLIEQTKVICVTSYAMYVINN